MRNKLLILTLAVCYSIFQPCFSQDVDVLWKGTGGKAKWEQTNYILFTVNGNNAEYLQNGRRFLIHRPSGQVRFEGRTNRGNDLVILFNYKTAKLKKYYINGSEAKLSNDVQASFQKVQEQFKKDGEFLFISTRVEAMPTKEKVSSRIINAEKLLSIPFRLPSNNINGELLFHPETGWIKQLIEHEGVTYLVDGYKDIGGGLYLPTIFKCVQDDNKSILFSTVAAFTEMQEDKFTQL